MNAAVRSIAFKIQEQDDFHLTVNWFWRDGGRHSAI